MIDDDFQVMRVVSEYMIDDDFHVVKLVPDYDDA